MDSGIPVFPQTPVLLVDGDIVAYRAAAAAEKTKYLVTDGTSSTGQPLSFFDTAKEAKADVSSGDHIWSRKEVSPESFALQCLQSTMDAIALRFPQSIIQVYLSGERNFRDFIWKTKKYKGNRIQERPRHLEAVRQALISRWFAVVSKDQEADDDIGVASGDGTVVVSTDKDLDQIPGWHYNWVKEELYWVTPSNAEQYFWEQVISGDPTDNIPGLPGMGPIKARAYLDDTANHQGGTVADYHDAVFALFQKSGFKRDYLEEMCDLIRIKRSQ